MKAPRFTVIASAALTLVSCGSSTPDPAPAPATVTLFAPAKKELTYVLDSSSVVRWKGTTAAVYSHEGTVKFTDGSITLKGDSIMAGLFSIDMKSIRPTDGNFSSQENRTPENLMGHLMSHDFFAVDSFPTATFVITGQKGNSATGDLTVRGRTDQESVKNVVIWPNADGTLKASGTLVFDRQKYGVAWTSPKDMILQDNIELEIELNGRVK